MAAPNGAGFGQLAALYRQVLRVHRDKLPGPLRMLGDGYAAEEFRRHLKGKTTAAQWQEFGTQWQSYVSALREDTQQPQLVPDVVQLDHSGAAAAARAAEACCIRPGQGRRHASSWAALRP